MLKRRYLLFYALNFLQGLRKQMFITFAIFALVKVHGMPVETTMILVLINQVLITLTASWMGRLVDRFGERRMLTLSYSVLVFVFLGYAHLWSTGRVCTRSIVSTISFSSAESR